MNLHVHRWCPVVVIHLLYKCLYEMAISMQNTQKLVPNDTRRAGGRAHAQYRRQIIRTIKTRNYKAPTHTQINSFHTYFPFKQSKITNVSCLLNQYTYTYIINIMVVVVVAGYYLCIWWTEYNKKIIYETKTTNIWWSWG